MKNIFKISLVLMFALLFASFASADLTVGTVTTFPLTASHGTTVSGTLNLTNTDTANSVTSITYTAANLTSGTDTIASSAVTFSDTTTSLAASAADQFTVSVAVPGNQAPGTSYSGNITVSGTSNSTTVTVTYNLQVTVNTSTTVDVQTYDASTPLKITTQDDTTKTSNISVKNTGNVALTLSASSFTYTQSDFTDNDAENITLTFSDIESSLAAGVTDTVTISAAVPDKMDTGTYSGTINVTSGSATDSFKLEVRVQPEICEDGEVGSNLRIEDLDLDDDEYKPGNTIEIDVKVENRDDDDDLDVVVEAFLYNLDDEEFVVDVKSDSLTIDSDDTETFTLELKVPYDDSLDESDDYILYVKAYEDGEEDNQCVEDSETDIDIKRDKHSVIVEALSVSPSRVQPGSTAAITVTVRNIGTSKEDDVYVKVLENLLKINDESVKFDLDKYNKNDADALRRFTVTVPKDAEAKEYQIEVAVYYDGGDESTSDFASLTVEGQPVAAVGAASVSVASGFGSLVKQGSSFSVPVLVTNNEKTAKTYALEIVNTDDWADPVSSKTVTLNPGQSTTLYVYVQPKSTVSGKQSAIINLKEGGNVVASETLLVDIQPKEESTTAATVSSPAPVTGKSVVDTVKDQFSGNTVWVMLDVVLVVIGIFFIKMLFFARKP